VDRTQEGWVPEQMIQVKDEFGWLLENYTAKELILFQDPNANALKNGIQLDQGLVFFPELWSASHASPLSAWYLWRGFCFNVVGIAHGYFYIEIAIPPTYVYTNVLYQGKVIQPSSNPKIMDDRLYRLKSYQWYMLSNINIGNMSQPPNTGNAVFIGSFGGTG